MSVAAERLSGTVRLPAAYAVLQALSKVYIQPDRLRTARLRDSACASLRLVPELLVQSRADSDEVILASRGRAAQVDCPREGPLFSHASCLRRLAFAATRLVDDLKPSELDRLLANGLLEGLDPHTILMWNDAQTCQFTPEGCGEREIGIGLRLGRTGRGLVVLSVLPGGPAQRAGLEPGDRLVSIDGLSATGLAPLETQWLLQGSAGSQVVLIIERPGSTKPMRARITRRELKDQSAFRGSIRGEVAVLKVDAFVPGVARQVGRWLEDDRNVHGVVLDLRDNPGGLITEVLRLADLFLDRGALVVVESRDGREKVDVPARSGGTFRRVPMVVLVNARSASASELLAGTLKDNKRALIMGQRTFGKGTMQMPVEVLGGVLLVTVSRFSTGTGAAIQARGIQPDVELRPVIVTRERIRLHHWPPEPREEQEEGALDVRTDGGAVAKAPITMRYLRSESPLDDSAVALAVEFVKRIPWMGGLVDRARAARDLLAPAEDEKINRALNRLGLRPGPPAAGKPIFSVRVTDARLLTGRTARLPIDVQNKGTRTLAGLTCHLETLDPIFADREVAIPPIQPGRSARVVVEAFLPGNALEREDPVELVWHMPDGRVESSPPGRRFFLRIEDPPEPVLGLDVELARSGPTEPLCPGDRVELCATVQNFTGDVTPAFVAVDARLGPITGWTRGYHRFEGLGPGKRERICFEGVARSRLQDGIADQTVHFGDRFGRVLGSRAVKVVTRAKCDPRPARRPPAAAADVPAPGFSPWLDVTAGRLYLEGDALDLRVQAKANGGSLRDLTVFVAGKKVDYRQLEGPEIDLLLSLPITEAGLSLVQVLVRKDSKTFSSESFVVRRASPGH